MEFQSLGGFKGTEAVFYNFTLVYSLALIKIRMPLALEISSRKEKKKVG